MRFYKYLYVQEQLEKKKDKIINKLKQNKVLLSCYVVALSVNPKNQLDIYSSKYLFQPGFPTEDLFVVAIVKSHEDALEFVENLVKDVYNETKRTDIRSYILEKEQEG
jgi:hypothetical protein